MVSIIICTCNRAANLKKTLTAMEGVLAPDGMACELIVVDNASTDETRAVVETAQLSQMPIRYIYEANRGQSNARNTGMAQAQGDIFLWTDDDVHPPPDWISSMCQPIVSGLAGAVAGGIELAPHLQRPWMTSCHRAYLAATDLIDAKSPAEMYGGNMAFAAKAVQEKMQFDTNLGPGQLGFCDDTLFSAQLLKSGCKIVSRLDIKVEHHFEASRLNRASFLSRAAKQGASQAYIAHHWQHHVLQNPLPTLWRRFLRLNYWRLKRLGRPEDAEGAPEWEMGMVTDVHFVKQYMIESKLPRNYEKFGLVKTDWVESSKVNQFHSNQ